MNQSKKRARLAQKFEETKTALTSECFEKRSASPSKTERFNENKDSKNFDSNKNVEIVIDKCSSNDDNRNAVTESDDSEKSKANLEERIKNFLRTKTVNKSAEDGSNGSTACANEDVYVDDEYTEHFLPTQVDTDDVSGVIVQVRLIHVFCVK